MRRETREEEGDSVRDERLASTRGGAGAGGAGWQMEGRGRGRKKLRKNAEESKQSKLRNKDNQEQRWEPEQTADM
eukprot:763726-Hanusia_phi.AAC.1